MRLCVFFILAALGFNSFGKTLYFRVVDTEGNPVEGASVEVGWFSVSVEALRPLTLDPKHVDKKRVSGKDGRFKVRWAPEWACDK